MNTAPAATMIAEANRIGTSDPTRSTQRPNRTLKIIGTTVSAAASAPTVTLSAPSENATSGMTSRVAASGPLFRLVNRRVARMRGSEPGAAGACGDRDSLLDVSFHQVVHPGRTEETGVATLQMSSEARMNSHENARLTRHSRGELVRRVIVEGQPVATVARSFGVTPRTVRKWVDRYQAEGETGLRNRSSRPHRLYRPTPAATVRRIEVLRRERWTGTRIAMELGVSPATVSRALRRLGLSRVRDLAPAEPVRRYERDRPGDLIHLDIKKLGRFERVGHRITGDRRGQSNSRGVGWEYVHVAIDDHSRLATSQIMPDEKAVSAVAALRAAIDFYRRLGVTVERVMTDNGSCYKSFAFRDACRALGLRHIRTRPYTPKTNGKAERFIKTALEEWAYARAYQTSDQRANHLPLWLHSYNWHRQHGGIKAMKPIQRLGLSEDNLLRMHS